MMTTRAALKWLKLTREDLLTKGYVRKNNWNARALDYAISRAEEQQTIEQNLKQPRLHNRPVLYK